MSVRLRDVRWSAGGHLIVDGITLDIASGTTFGLLGPNGSGKSSLLRLIAGLRRVASGVVILGDAELMSLSRRAIARRTAFVEQQTGTEIPLTVLDVVRLGRTPHRGPLAPWTVADGDAVEAALAEVGLSDRRGQPWHTLSGGERQRTQIARALAQEPQELLLDEPTNHLDIQHQLEVLALVRRLPATVVVALHDLNLAAMFCDAVAVLQDGCLVAAGPPSTILTEELIRSVFRVSARVESSPYDGRHRIQFLSDAIDPSAA